MVAFSTVGAALVTNTPLPLRACSQVSWPSVVSGRPVPFSVTVWPVAATYCTPLGVSTNGFWVAPWPPNR